MGCQPGLQGPGFITSAQGMTMERFGLGRVSCESGICYGDISVVRSYDKEEVFMVVGIGERHKQERGKVVLDATKCSL